MRKQARKRFRHNSQKPLAGTPAKILPSALRNVCDDFFKQIGEINGFSPEGNEAKLTETGEAKISAMSALSRTQAVFPAITRNGRSPNDSEIARMRLAGG